jgi:hypothetical protein
MRAKAFFTKTGKKGITTSSVRLNVFTSAFNATAVTRAIRVYPERRKVPPRTNERVLGIAPAHSHKQGTGQAETALRQARSRLVSGRLIVRQGGDLRFMPF